MFAVACFFPGRAKDLAAPPRIYEIPILFHVCVEAGVCRNTVRGICRMSWPSLGGKFKKINMWYVTNILNEGSNFGFDLPIIKRI